MRSLARVDRACCSETLSVFLPTTTVVQKLRSIALSTASIRKHGSCMLACCTEQDNQKKPHFVQWFPPLMDLRGTLHVERSPRDSTLVSRAEVSTLFELFFPATGVPTSKHHVILVANTFPRAAPVHFVTTIRIAFLCRSTTFIKRVVGHTVACKSGRVFVKVSVCFQGVFSMSSSSACSTSRASCDVKTWCNDSSVLSTARR